MLDLLADAAAWTQARGFGNWPARFSRRFIESHARAGELHAVKSDGVMIATLTLQRSDPRFWGETDVDAGYVHRLAVSRALAGRGMGCRLLDWADAQVRARGGEYLRLDVVSSNAPLRRYYECAGFEYQRDVSGEEALRDGTRRAWQTSLYERPCSRVGSAR